MVPGLRVDSFISNHTHTIHSFKYNLKREAATLNVSMSHRIKLSATFKLRLSGIKHITMHIERKDRLASNERKKVEDEKNQPTNVGNLTTTKKISSKDTLYKTK